MNFYLFKNSYLQTIILQSVWFGQFSFYDVSTILGY